MRPHPRIRKTIKWGGLFVVLAVVVLYVTTTGRYSRAVKVNATHYTMVVVVAGRVEVTRVYMSASPTDPTTPFEWESTPLTTRIINWGFGEWRFDSVIIATIPFWTPALAALVASAFAWRLDTLATRRAKLGACPTCSYSRTGLAPSSPCPECGAAAPHA